MNCNETLIIEFFGMPASGKSTLTNKVICNLRKKGLKISNLNKIEDINNIFLKRIYKIFVMLKYCFLKPKSFYEIFRLVNLSNQNSKEDYIKVLINIVYIQYKILKAKKEMGIFVLDQGYLQSIWSIMLNASQSNIRLLDNINKLISPNLLVEVRTNKQRIKERLSLRNKRQSRIDYHNEDRLDESIENFEFLCKKSKINDMKKLIINNNTDKDLELNVRKITDFILENIK